MKYEFHKKASCERILAGAHYNPNQPESNWTPGWIISCNAWNWNCVVVGNFSLRLLIQLLLVFPKILHDHFVKLKAPLQGSPSTMKKVKYSLQRKMVLIYRETIMNRLCSWRANWGQTQEKFGTSGTEVSQINTI